MLCKFLVIILFLLNAVKGIEELEEINLLNDFITITSDMKSTYLYFSLNKECIIYFDSINQNCLVYIYKDNPSLKERIDGKFYKALPNINYYISVELYESESSSILKRYISPLDLSNEEIIIKDNNINFLYLTKNKKFTLNFINNSLDRMITLSKKSLNGNIAITKDSQIFQLNKDNLYYKIGKEFKGQLILETDDNDALIEFITGFNSEDDYKILDKTYYNIKNYELNTKTTVIEIPKTQKEIEIKIFSSQFFTFSFSNGFTDDSSYYYNSFSNKMVNSTKKDGVYVAKILYHNLFRNISLIEGEIFSFGINLYNFNDYQKIFLNYIQSTKIDNLMDEEITETYCKQVITLLKTIFEYYVYSDIAKNPPTIPGYPNYHHEKIDFQDRLNKVSTTNRKFYEFYQEIQTIISTVKDRHLWIIASQTANGNKFSGYSVNLPFNFEIKQHESEYKIFIKKNDYADKYPPNIKEFIEKHESIPVKYINNMNPFDYIQNWSIFKSSKNKHAQFTKRINEISHFNLNAFPLNYSELIFNEYEFDDDELIRISYYIDIPKLQYSLEFQNYLSNVEKSYEHEDTLPNIDKIYNDFLKFKGIGQNSNNGIKASINWNTDLSQEENNKVFKCRVDEVNKVNVIYQNSFGFKKYFYDIIPKMLQCAKKFFENDYPVIIIESQNSGGSPFLYSILLQILQPRIEMKDYRSFRVTSTSESYLINKNQFKGKYTQSDCQELENYADITKFYDDNYGDNSIHHNRTDPLDVLPKMYRLALKEFINEFKNNKNIKNPTDIIIFTDSYSFSAGSGFIKGFQNAGGAVTVGYYGNPKIQGTEMYDASQSPSQVEHFDNTNLKNELIKIGFDKIGVTIAESYNFHQNDIIIQIPREYDIDAVDFRVNIYSDYSDEKYQEFIDEGLKIHKLLNVNNECNPKNTKLLLHSE